MLFTDLRIQNIISAEGGNHLNKVLVCIMWHKVILVIRISVIWFRK